MDDEELASISNDTNQNKGGGGGGGKKSKKERRKKKDLDDDEDLDTMLAELHMEIVEGKKLATAAAVATTPNATTKTDSVVQQEASKNHQITNDNKNDEDDDEEEEKSSGAGKNKKKKKKDNKKSNQQQQQPDKTQQQPTKSESEPKTQKKSQKPPPATSVKSSDDLKTESNNENNKVEPTPPTTTMDGAGDASDGAEDNDGGGGEDSTATSKKDKKKKRKDKKKDDKDSKPSGGGGKVVGGPNKKQLALIQELLKKQKEEEERFQREEEERIRREEERERERLEKERIEKEKKERKKQKEKERKLRLKKEGKLLTAKQKAQQQRAQMNLQLLKESGQAVIGKVKKESTTGSGAAGNKVDSKESSEETPIDEQKNDDDTEPIDEEDLEDDAADAAAAEDEEELLDDWEEIIVQEKKIKQQQQTKTQPKNQNASTTTTTIILLLQIQKMKVVVIHKKNLSTKLSTNPASKPPEKFRSPIICVLGHVDTGKTKLLDYIRKSHVQDNEAGGITQQIGATFIPPTAIKEQCKHVKLQNDLKIPGLLIIDTPGHESFSNLRSRGSSLCDIAILVIDIMHGLENQTIESLNLLKKRKTPFVVALNKIDRLYEWRSNIRKDIEDLINSQQSNTKHEFNTLKQKVILQLNEQSINAALFYENPDPRTYISLVPTSAHTGDGMGNLINLITHFTQNMMAKRITYQMEPLDATVLEVKALPGLGTTIDVVLVNGKLREGDKIVLAGHDGPIVTQIRALLIPQPLKELRIKSPYDELREVYGSVGVKIAAHDLEKAVAGLNLYVAQNETELERLKTLCWNQFGTAMKSIKCQDKGVYVQASTLGALEALLEFLKESKIPYSGVRIGPVAKRDVMKASIMLETSPDNAVILAFDVKIERDAQELADQLGVKIFHADIIYHLFDQFTAYKEDIRKQRKEQNRHLAVFPCKLRILPNCIFNKRDPIVLGVHVEGGKLMPGTPLAVPTKELDMIGRVISIEHEHKIVEHAKKGDEVCIKIEHCSSDAPKMYGRHFDHTDLLYSRITRESIDIMKEHFRDEMANSDWQLIIELKKVFGIL